MTLNDAPHCHCDCMKFPKINKKGVELLFVVCLVTNYVSMLYNYY